MRLKETLIIFPLLVLLTGCGPRQEAKAPSVTEEPPESSKDLGAQEERNLGESTQNIKRFSLSGYSESGQIEWEIQGASADVSNPQTVKLEQVVATTYTEKNSIRLQAKEAHIDRQSNDVHLQTDVEVTTSEGARLTAEYLDWSENLQTLTTDSKVFIKRDNIQLEGRGMHAQPNLNQAMLREEVTVKVEPATVITCQGPLQIDYEQKKAIFSKDVKIENQRGQLYGDEAVVLFDPETETITEVVVTGNVKIVREGNTAYSQKAIYQAKDGKVTLTGQPTLVIYSKNEIAGD